MKKNEGELPQYYVKDNHEAIIEPKVFDYVQDLLKKRKLTEEKKYSGVGMLNSKVVCAECGAYFGPRTWHPNSPHTHLVWECPNRYKKIQCKTVHIYDKYLKYIIHDVAKKEVLERNLVKTILRILRYSVDKEKYDMLVEYLEEFNMLNVWNMKSDLEDLSLIIETIIVFKSRKLEIKLIDREILNGNLGRYSPRRFV